MAIAIRSIERSDALEWEAMRRDLWPDGCEDHATEISAFFAGILGEPQAVLVAQNLIAQNDVGPILGFAELAVRMDLADCAGKRVGYVEGLYVAPAFRGGGIARQLLRAARLWARENGCDAFASDRAEPVILDRSFSVAMSERVSCFFGGLLLNFNFPRSRKRSGRKLASRSSG